MRLIVLVEWGPRRWTKFVAAPGQRLRVGRYERAEICVPHDEEMSGLHCELRWDGVRCSVTDLGSVNGTFLNGMRATEGELEHGEWFQAGETVLSIYVEGHLSAWTPAPRKVPVSPEMKNEALVALRAEPLPMFAVLDRARDDRIGEILRCSVEPAQSLYDGRDGEALEDVAPFLVALPKESWLLERLVLEGWGQRWGIYLTSVRPFKEVRRDLRRNLIVVTKERAEQLYFRFYDPAVMRASFATKKNAGRIAQWGDIQSFLLEGDAGRIICLRADADRPYS